MDRLITWLAPQSVPGWIVRTAMFIALILGVDLCVHYAVNGGFYIGDWRAFLAIIVLVSLPFVLIFFFLFSYLHRLKVELGELALTDMLTGLPNRRAFLGRIGGGEAGAHAALDGFLLLLDVDNFKRVNDSYGHAVGDQCLRALAERLREVTRAGDRVGRLGGEEFGVFLTDAPRDRAEAIGLRLAAALQVAARGQGVTLAITCSVGATQVRRGLPLERPFHEADRALYAAKAAGRARFTFFDQDWPPQHAAA